MFDQEPFWFIFNIEENNLNKSKPNCGWTEVKPQIYQILHVFYL